MKLVQYNRSTVLLILFYIKHTHLSKRFWTDSYSFCCFSRTKFCCNSCANNINTHTCTASKCTWIVGTVHWLLITKCVCSVNFHMTFLTFVTISTVRCTHSSLTSFFRFSMMCINGAWVKSISCKELPRSGWTKTNTLLKAFQVPLHVHVPSDFVSVHK